MAGDAARSTSYDVARSGFGCWSFEGPAIYISHDGKVTKSAPEAVRLASADEAVGMSIHEQLDVMEQGLDLSDKEMRDNRDGAGDDDDDDDARPDDDTRPPQREGIGAGVNHTLG